MVQQVDIDEIKNQFPLTGMKNFRYFRDMKAEISLSFNQLLELVKQLPKGQKLKLSKELEKDEIYSKLTQLLNEFRTDELSYEDITEEVEAVRKELYEKK